MKPNVNFLIIEDQDELDLLVDSIRETGLKYENIIPRSIEQAKDRLLNDTNFNPDYIFIEWNPELLRFIRSIPRLSNTEVIVYVINVNTDDFKQAKLLGATHVLLKTTHETTLSRVLYSLYQTTDNHFVMSYHADKANSYLR
ncbi:MAG: hypothetical protein KIS94_05910 [Chitinophagales bacterium]|nr:hypothetical protein [Chitinophagales bacterium]